MTFEIEEGQRQMVLLAISELALSRPGWDYALGEVAKQLRGEEMFAEFKRLNADRVWAQRAPLTFGPLVAQSDDPELLEWLSAADRTRSGRSPPAPPRTSRRASRRVRAALHRTVSATTTKAITNKTIT